MATEPKGITVDVDPPCPTPKFSTHVLDEIVKDHLPGYLKSLRGAWGNISMGQVSGLAPTAQGGSIDNCIIGGAWSVEQQSSRYMAVKSQ